MKQSHHHYRIQTDATITNRYIASVQRRILWRWVEIKSYATRPNPDDADMDYARLCAQELLEHLQANETI